MIDSLVFVSMEDWDDVWRRNQFLCAGLARRYPELKILFVGRPRNVAHHLRDGRVGELANPLTHLLMGHPNIWVTQALRFGPERFEWGRRLNEAVTRAHVRRVMKRFGILRPLLWLNPHYAVHLAGRMGESAVVYDITDDWTLASLSDRERALVCKQDDALCRVADLVIVCSDALAKSRAGRCRRLLKLPNGVEADHYRSVSDPALAGTDTVWPRPIFGYTGTLHPDRVDVGLIGDLARAYPQGSIVLIGPDNLDGPTRSALQRYTNVHLVGPIPYSDLPQQMAHFDVCIVPHLESNFTESLNPLKLWEYLAGGKPIVSTDLAGFRDFPSLCRIASGGSSFVAACAAALEERGARREERWEVARLHTWDARLESLVAALQALGVIR